MPASILAMLLGSASIHVGAKAPAFTLPDTEGHQVTLSELVHDGPVILFFFPKAFTSG